MSEKLTIEVPNEAIYDAFNAILAAVGNKPIEPPEPRFWVKFTGWSFEVFDRRNANGRISDVWFGSKTPYTREQAKAIADKECLRLNWREDPGKSRYRMEKDGVAWRFYDGDRNRGGYFNRFYPGCQDPNGITADELLEFFELRAREKEAQGE